MMSKSFRTPALSLSPLTAVAVLVRALLFCDAKVVPLYSVAMVEDAPIAEMKTFLECVSVKLYLTQTGWFYYIQLTRALQVQVVTLTTL